MEFQLQPNTVSRAQRYHRALADGSFNFSLTVIGREPPVRQIPPTQLVDRSSQPKRPRRRAVSIFTYVVE